MIWLGISLIVLAGVAEHYKDLSEEGKLKKHPYWDKNYLPDFNPLQLKYIPPSYFKDQQALWWKSGWLMKYKWLPTWIGQYLSFRDGWHLLKFCSLNLYVVGIVVLFSTQWWWFLILRTAFSLPETILRFSRKKFQKNIPDNIN